VQNTRKDERLTFDRLDPYAGTWLHATGEYADLKGKTRRVAISIGPEHGTVGSQQVKEAAKEAVRGVGFDMLVVCGFAFDPHVAEEAKRYGKLTVLPAKMNPDLAMGDELLKKTGAGNLFMVFGEPDVEITKQKNRQIVAEIKGVDVYDPTTGHCHFLFCYGVGRILFTSRKNVFQPAAVLGRNLDTETIRPTLLKPPARG
jgi:adenine-specific DNA-methyltransferase